MILTIDNVIVHKWYEKRKKRNIKSFCMIAEGFFLIKWKKLAAKREVCYNDGKMYREEN